MGEAIFRFLFKYPPVAYARGRLTLASGWPGWLLAVLILLVVAGVGLYLWRLRPRPPRRQRALVWGLQSLAVAILLLMLWRPALVLSTLVPQRNLVAVLLDGSASMALAEHGVRRVDQVRETFEETAPLLAQLREKFQVRLYQFSQEPRKLSAVAGLAAAGASSQLEAALAQTYAELQHLPLAGIVVVSDGAQNGPESPREALAELRARKIPVYAVGVGAEEFDRDIQVDDVAMPRAALPGSLISATVTVRHHGYIGQKARIEIREGNSVLKSREIQFSPAPIETVTLNFTPKSKGLREFTVAVAALPGEAIRENNRQSRLVEVQDRQAKVLYLEGEPRWEYKFLHRALEEDHNLRLVSLLRTSENKFYRQGIENAQELASGLPERKELFRYEGIILGSIPASFFSPRQQEDLYAFVSRRGGGLLFLGGRFALADGGYSSSSLADLIPVQLQASSGSATLRRVPAKFQLTPRGWDRLELSENESSNRKDWEALPPLGNYQVTGAPKPGAVVLGEAVPSDGQRYPVLVSERFGRGRTLLFSTDASWRWRMELESSSRSHELFWRQILHSLVNDTPPPVSITAEKSLYADESRVRLLARVYDEDFQPVSGASTVATLYAPDGSQQELRLEPSVEEEGVFRGEWDAVPPGVYRLEVAARAGDKEIGKSDSYFQRADGLAESFSAEQNVALLKRLAEQTGGAYYPIENAGALPEQLTYSPAGISVPEVRDLWDLPALFLLLFLAKGSEWVLRKRWRTI